MIMGVPASAVPPGTARLGGGEFLNAAAGQYIQQATGTTTIDGTFTNQGVVRNNDGAMTVGPGGTYRQLFQSIPFVDTRTVNNGTFTNAGTVQLDFGEFSNQGKMQTRVRSKSQPSLRSRAMGVMSKTQQRRRPSSTERFRTISLSSKVCSREPGQSWETSSIPAAWSELAMPPRQER
jgi:hypothetical protein